MKSHTQLADKSDGRIAQNCTNWMLKLSKNLKQNKFKLYLKKCSQKTFQSSKTVKPLWLCDETKDDNFYYRNLSEKCSFENWKSSTQIETAHILPKKLKWKGVQKWCKLNLKHTISVCQKGFEHLEIFLQWAKVLDLGYRGWDLHQRKKR